MTKKLLIRSVILLFLISSAGCKKDNSQDEDNYVTVWHENFESYEVNTFPSTWVKDGNASSASTNFVTDQTSSEGSKSLQLYGSVGGCWGSIGYRALNTTSPYFIEMDIKNGTENLSGCHPNRAAIVLRQGTSWTNPGRLFVYFYNDGNIHLGDEISDKFSTDIWYTVKIKYDKISSSEVKITYWINNVLKGEYTVDADSGEDEFTNLEIAVEEGTAWFDNITVMKQ